VQEVCGHDAGLLAETGHIVILRDEQAYCVREGIECVQVRTYTHDEMIVVYYDVT
jgi:hypothetical protein